MKNRKKIANRKKRQEKLLNNQAVQSVQNTVESPIVEETDDIVSESQSEEIAFENVSEDVFEDISEGDSDEFETTEETKDDVILSNENSSDRIFALDVGTRSVIGIVAEPLDDGDIKILATTRKEHKTRAMLDGQIHDVPEVAAVIREIKDTLEKETGKLESAAVAAAGRALYTMKGAAELKLSRVITEADEKNLEFLGVQDAVESLQNSKTPDDTSNYYCVGYSVISYTLDDTQLKSLIGQRGDIAKVTVIATFLPRQVIDSMQSALLEADLTMRALTLEPIAAINVLIPPTMRHLNIALVDIGAGTSDVALTKDGSVFAYGMVPLAGDEITEALSQRFLLDFKVAENIKRKAALGENVEFSDILGTNYNLTPEEITEPLTPAVKTLAEAIAKEIINQNGSAPQAVILVGGGALTPNLSKAVAEFLDMPEDRVAVRKPEKVEGITSLPDELQTSDSVTPLGILKIASINTLHFLTIYVNGEKHDLFNFKELTVSDALLNAGVNLKKFNGRPGLALTVTVEGETRFFPGEMGTLAKVKLNGSEATLDSKVGNEDRIEILPGVDGTIPKVLLKDVVKEVEDKTIRLNGKDVKISTGYVINGQPSDMDSELKDGDVIERVEGSTVREVLKRENLSPEGKRINYTLNGNKSYFTLAVEILLNGNPANLSARVMTGDVIKYNVNDRPTLKDVLDIDENSTNMRILFNKKEYYIPMASAELTVNGEAATEKTVITDGADIVYKEMPRATTTVSDALLAVNFEPPPATSRMKFDILVNGRSAEFIDPVKNGDSLEVVLTKIGEPSPVPSTETSKLAEKKETPISELKDLADRAVPVGNFKNQFNAIMQKSQTEPQNTPLIQGVPNIPGLSEAIAASKE